MSDADLIAALRDCQDEVARLEQYRSLGQIPRLDLLLADNNRLRGLLGEVLTAYKEQAGPLRDEREPERYRRWAEELVTKVETELAAELGR